MFLFHCFVILLFIIQTNFCLNEFFVSTANKNSIYQFRCIDHFHIQIHSIQYLYDKYNCSIRFHRHDISHPFNVCINQSSCMVNLKSWFIHHEQRQQRQSVKCHSIKLKHILFNYTCVNVTNVSMNISSRISSPTNSFLFNTKNTTLTTLALGICIIGFLLLIACICSSSGRRSSTITTLAFDPITSGLQTINNNDSDTLTSMNSTWNDTYNSLPSNLLLHLQQQSLQGDHSIVQTLNESNCQLKKIVTTLSSSPSTSTTLDNKNILTNPSEYDNLISNNIQQSKVLSPFHPDDMSGSRLPNKYPLKVTFNENCHFK